MENLHKQIRLALVGFDPDNIETFYKSRFFRYLVNLKAKVIIDDNEASHSEKLTLSCFGNPDKKSIEVEMMQEGYDVYESDFVESEKLFFHDLYNSMKQNLKLFVPKYKRPVEMYLEYLNNVKAPKPKKRTKPSQNVRAYFIHLMRINRKLPIFSTDQCNDAKTHIKQFGIDNGLLLDNTILNTSTNPTEITKHKNFIEIKQDAIELFKTVFKELPTKQ